MFFLYLLYKKEHKMEKELLYKFFEGKASFEEKEAIRIWLESSSKNEQYLFKEREFFDAMILSGESLTPIKVRLKKSLSKFICEFLKDYETSDVCFFIYPYSGEFKEKFFVFSDVIKISPYWQRSIYNADIKNKKLVNLFNEFRENKIFYSSLLCGTDFKQVIDFIMKK